MTKLETHVELQKMYPKAKVAANDKRPTDHGWHVELGNVCVYLRQDRPFDAAEDAGYVTASAYVCNNRGMLFMGDDVNGYTVATAVTAAVDTLRAALASATKSINSQATLSTF